MSTTSTSASSYFNGNSAYSAQLNNVISRTIGFATLPITQLQNQQSNLTNQQSEVQTLGSDFESIQSAIGALNSAASTASYSAAVDVPTVATASVANGALAGSYALNVTSIGSLTNTISASGTTAVTDPSSQNISTASTFNLTVNGKSYSLNPASKSLNALVASINSSGANVQATVVNVGGSASPDYRLSVQSTQYAPDTIQVNDGTSDLLTSLSAGSYVTYQINGQPSTPINSSSRNLSISTGLTADVLATGSANITVSQSTSNISNALSSLVTAYNAGVDELAKNRGQSGGALVGNSLVSQLQSALNAVGSYTGTSPSSGVNSLADIGLTFDQSGHLQFDESTFDSASSLHPSALASFLGSETGGGFIQSAYSTLTSQTDSSTGSITVAGNTIGTSITSLTKQISAKQDQVTQLQTTLTAQMASADATLQSLEGQITEITDLFAAETQAQKNVTG